jgi:hypothetical protein
MAKLERIELMRSPDYDDASIEMLVHIQEHHKIEGPVLRYRASLIDRTKSETQPQYSLFDDEDLQIRAQCIADPSVDLGVHHSEEAAIARCQEHHDTIYGHR